MLAVLVTLAATALLSTVTVWHLSSSTLDPPPGNGWYTRWRSTDPLAYRRQIQLATTTTQQPRARPRAAFDHVYVLSLPAREDRRADMQQLAQALAIDIDFVDAADKDEPFLQWIAERVAESRHLRRQVMAEARQVAPESIGGMSIGSDWVTPFPGNLSSHKSGDDEPARFPPYPTTENYGNRNWVSHLESLSASGGRHTSLRPSTSTSSSSLNVTALLWDPLEPLAVRQVHQGVISTYWGQTRAIKRMLENGDEVALILEDDVDVEWDLIDGFWDRIETKLPRRGDEYDWDVTFLGHCWGGEFQKPQYLHPLLHRSTGPMCLHGYALTARGAHRLLSHMLDPWSAFSTAIDLVIPSLLHIQSQSHHVPPLLLESFSVVPPLIVQRKDGPSDLQRGNGSKWRGLLRDSTVERIRRDRGEWNDDWEDRHPDDLDEKLVDPALKLRCAPV